MPSRCMPWVAVLLLIAPAARAQSSLRVVTGSTAPIAAGGVAGVEPCREADSRERVWDRAWRERSDVSDAASPVNVTRLARLAFDVSSGQVPAAAQETDRRRPKAVEYSEAYFVRAKIHKYTSLAMVPLFAAEFALGQSLYNNPGGGKRGAHAAVATGIAGVFGANTFTGVWNLKEGWKDANGRGRRTVHGVLMMLADAGFVATGMLAPEHEHERSGAPGTGGRNKATHRTVALSSMGVAAVSYLTMLLWRP